MTDTLLRDAARLERLVADAKQALDRAAREQERAVQYCENLRIDKERGLKGAREVNPGYYKQVCSDAAHLRALADYGNPNE